ncbi:MAG: FAD-dependent oxidoreductase, partial [Novosphingobium sp.]
MTQKRKSSADTYDVVIVGAGPAGLFAAHYLSEHSDLRVLVIDKGKAPRRRDCPMNEKVRCQRCKPCNMLSGVGGAGLFSDGKLNYIHKLGKTDLSQFMSVPQAQMLIDETEQIFNRFGMDGPVYPTNLATARAIRKTAKRHGIDLLIIRQKHLGTDRLPGYISEMADHIKSRGVAMHTSEEVRDIVVEQGRVAGVVTHRSKYATRNVILAPGRAGADWMGQVAAKNDLGVSQRGIEVGVRVEVHNDIMQDLCEVIYDPTFFIQTAKYD